MQGGMHVITHYYCIFNCRNQNITRDNTAPGSLWQRREIRKVWKVNLEKIWRVVHFNQGEKTDKFGKSIWRKYGQWLIMAKERDQTSLESLSFIFLALSSL